MGQVIYIAKKANPIFYPKYGLHYNWFVTQWTGSESVTSSDDWAVPPLATWQALMLYLDPSAVGGSNVAAEPLKYTIDRWATPGNHAANTKKFNWVGSGFRAGLFQNLNEFGYIQTSSSSTSLNSHRVFATDISKMLAVTYGGYNYIGRKTQGMAIRIVSDAVGITDGTEGTYTGNDGKTYRTIAINQKWWLADNLAETKKRNGSSIPEVTDQTTWDALTTGALCAYNNDWNNV